MCEERLLLGGFAIICATPGLAQVLGGLHFCHLLPFVAAFWSFIG
jgi:hypothetical protein